MWNRKELKSKGKAAFQANYWRCVIVALILTILVGGGIAAGGGNARDAYSDSSLSNEALTEQLSSIPSEVLAVVGAALIGASLIGFVVSLLVLNPLQVGCKQFFLVNSELPHKAELRELLHGFRNNYGRVVLAMFLRTLFSVLWTLLFIIPGIIKAYSYRMVPYILAEDPSVGAMEAIKRSSQMMKGHKWNTFVLDLSFLGWYLLAAVTFGIVNVLWTGPYTEATDAELYKAIR